MAEPRINPSPKQRALAVRGFIGRHRELVESDQFQESLDIAEAEYVSWLTACAPKDITASSSEQAAAACFQRILGMREFVKTLRCLSETPKISKKTESTDNLKQT